MTSNSSSANSSTTIENYVYVDGTKLVIKLAGVDTSTTLTADLAKAGWKKASDTYVTEVTKDIKDIISSTVDFFKELTEASSSSAADDTKASEKYTSTGEGNLTINYTASMTAKDESSVSHSAETTFKAAFDNYLPVSYSATATADGVKVLDASTTISWNKCDIKKVA